MPFRYNPSHWRERAAQMRADTEAAQHLCSSWRKTTTSLRIALEYARKNSRNQKRLLPTISGSRVPDSGSCRSRASGAIAQQKPRQLGDTDGDPPRRG
jgi:hypothetical protein